MKQIIFILVLIFIISVPMISFAAPLDTEDVTEVRVAAQDCYYRELPLNNERGDMIKKGDKIYVIGEVSFGKLNDDKSLIYLLCNTENGWQWVYKGFTEYNSAIVNPITKTANTTATEKPAFSVSTETSSNMIYMGTFKCTTYCPCTICNGGWSTTATGNPLTPWYTIAVDPRVIPLGSTVYIEGLGTFKAHDTGGAIKGHKIDVCVDSHAYAQVQTWYDMNVYIVK